MVLVLMMMDITRKQPLIISKRDAKRIIQIGYMVDEILGGYGLLSTLALTVPCISIRQMQMKHRIKPIYNSQESCSDVYRHYSAGQRTS